MGSQNCSQHSNWFVWDNFHTGVACQVWHRLNESFKDRECQHWALEQSQCSHPKGACKYLTDENTWAEKNQVWIISWRVIEDSLMTNTFTFHIKSIQLPVCGPTFSFFFLMIINALGLVLWHKWVKLLPMELASHMDTNSSSGCCTSETTPC